MAVASKLPCKVHDNMRQGHSGTVTEHGFMSIKRREMIDLVASVGLVYVLTSDCI